MELKEARENYQYHSGQASAVARQLAFAGIAIIWIFREVAPKPGEPLLSRDFLLPGLLIVVSLACDLLQYAWGALVWGVISRRRETSGGTAKAPPQVNWPTIVFFVGKLIAVAGAYVALGVALWGRLY